jgi:hypothetical protein
MRSLVAFKTAIICSEEYKVSSLAISELKEEKLVIYRALGIIRS